MLRRALSSITPTAEVRHALLIIAAAAVLCIQFLFIGVPRAYDAALHGLYQYYFSQQFWGGDFYPRWLAEANKGYGSPIFLVQYPFPYFITALMRPVLSFAPTAIRESRELGVYCFLMLAAAGLTARFWFRSRCTPVAATVGALVYIALPYTLGGVLYGRVAIGELAALVWIPLIFALCDRADRFSFGTVSAMSVAIALLWLSNILYVLLLIPVIIAYAVASGRRALPTVALGFAFSLCLAAAYLFPLAAYQRFFDARAFISHVPAAELGRNMAYISSDEVGHGIFIPALVGTLGITLWVTAYVWRSGGGVAARLAMLLTLLLGITMLIPGLGPAIIASSGLKTSGFESFAAYSMNILFTSLFTLDLALLAYCTIAREPGDFRSERTLLITACVAFWLMLPWSAFLWKVIPRTEIIQQPWRLSAILAVAAAGLFAVGLDDAARRARVGGRASTTAMLIAALVVVVAGIAVWRVDLRYRVLGAPPREDVTRWVDSMYVTYVPPQAVAAFAKRIGASTPFDIVPTTVERGVQATFMSGTGQVSVKRLTPRKLAVSATCTGDCRMQLGQLYFPLWKIVSSVGSAPEQALSRSAGGLMEVSLGSGMHSFELVFDGGLAEQAGYIVSLVSIVLLLAGWVVVGAQSRLQRPIAAG